VLFIERDQVVQQIAPTTLDPALGYAVLPRTLERGSQGSDRQGSNGSRNLHSIFAIAVKNKKPQRRVKRKRFPELLHNPLARRVLGNVEVQNPPSIVANDE